MKCLFSVLMENMKTLNLFKHLLIYLKNLCTIKYQKKTKALINKKKINKPFINCYLTLIVILIVVLAVF